MKRAITITVDEEAYKKAKEQHLNISQVLSDFLVEFTGSNIPEFKDFSEKLEQEQEKILKSKIEIQNKEAEFLQKKENLKHEAARKLRELEVKKYFCEHFNREVDINTFKLVNGQFPKEYLNQLKIIEELEKKFLE